MTITFTPSLVCRLNFIVAGAVLLLATAAFTRGATPASNAAIPSSRFAESSAAFNSTPMRQLAPAFPAIGLIVAAWATHHVRRRNARRLASIK